MPQQLDDLGPIPERPHLVAGVPIHVADGGVLFNVENADQEDETSSLAEEHSTRKHDEGYRANRPTRNRHVCNASVSRTRGDSFSRAVHGGASQGGAAMALLFYPCLVRLPKQSPHTPETR